jgi:hypothetical protein
MATRLALAAFAFSLAAPARAADPASACAREVPASLAAPAGNQLAFATEAEGVQIYTCAAKDGAHAWAFKAPEARLESGGKAAGKHYAGPTWEALDGSKVVGARVEGATPDPSAIPWLLLRAASHDGKGQMADVSFVQRIQTTGGNPAKDGCGPANVGAELRVPYRAVYCFLRAQK